MRQQLVIGLVLLAFGGLVQAQGEAKRAQVPDEYVGLWAGSWGMTADATDGGSFEMTIEKDKDGAPAGKMTVSGGEGTHSAVFKSLSFDGNKMSASYDYPLGDGGEIVLEATFEKGAGTGTWSLHPQRQAAGSLRTAPGR
jgi:hypothetical protein